MCHIPDIPLKLTPCNIYMGTNSSLKKTYNQQFVSKYAHKKPSNRRSSTFFKDETHQRNKNSTVTSWLQLKNMHACTSRLKSGSTEKNWDSYNENRDWNKRFTFNLLQGRLTGILASKLKWVVACSQTVTFTLPINDVTACNQVFIAWLKAQELVVIPVFIWTGMETEAFISEDITIREIHNNTLADQTA